MAAISLRKIILYDRWPGVVNPNMSMPTNGFDSTKEGSGNCVSEALFPIGAKIQCWNDGTYNPGPYTMQYLQFVEGSDSAYDAADPSTGYGACFWYCATQHHPDGNNVATWYIVTHDLTNSDGSQGGAVAFPACDLSGAETTGSNAPEFGWFWVGGVNPCVTSPTVDMTGLGGEMKTDGDIIGGVEFCFEDDGTNAASIIPYCLTAIFELTAGIEDATMFNAPAGKALGADA